MRKSVSGSPLTITPRALYLLVAIAVYGFGISSAALAEEMQHAHKRPHVATQAAPATPATSPQATGTPSKAASATVPAPSPSLHEAPTCLSEIAKTEARYRLPAGILLSIALAESGRRDSTTGLLVPWAWTLNTHGEGRYFNTADEAVREASRHLEQNDSLIDVGCMQIDLFHHPAAFRTLHAALDPETNVDYAARFLTTLHAAHGSWPMAIAAYHAGNTDSGEAGSYLARVLYFWREIRVTATNRGTSTNALPFQKDFLIEEVPQPMDLAADFFVHQNYEPALALYRAQLISHPDDLTALLGLAECLLATAHVDEAYTALLRGFTVDPRNRVIESRLLNLIDKQPPAQRRVHLVGLREISPNSLELLTRTAMAEVEDGEINQAVADIAAALRLKPNDPVLLLDEALLLDRQGRIGAARDAYQAFLAVYRPGDTIIATSVDSVRERYAYLVKTGD